MYQNLTRNIKQQQQQQPNKTKQTKTKQNKNKTKNKKQKQRYQASPLDSACSRRIPTSRHCSS
jgi:hypothetical protein